MRDKTPAVGPGWELDGTAGMTRNWELNRAAGVACRYELDGTAGIVRGCELDGRAVERDAVVGVVSPGCLGGRHVWDVLGHGEGVGGSRHPVVDGEWGLMSEWTMRETGLGVGHSARSAFGLESRP